MVLTGSALPFLLIQGTVPPVGRSTGHKAVRSAFNRRGRGLEAGGNEDTADTFTTITPPEPASVAITTHTGLSVVFEGAGGQQWFEKLHVYPNNRTENPLLRQVSKIEYGNILGQLDKQYVIYNAFRSDIADLGAIVNGITPGIETPGVSVSDTINPQTSLYNPSSIFNDAVTDFNNRVIVTFNLRALLEGLPNFDGDVQFVFDIGSVTLSASGSRISIIVEEYGMPFSETESYLTDIIPSKDGSEQRIALRLHPREEYKTLFQLDGIDRQRLHAQIFGFHAQNFGLPMWQDVVRTTATAAVSATQYQISGGDDVDFRVGGLAVIITNANVFDVIPIIAVTDTLITSSSASQFEHLAGSRILPVRSVRIKGGVRTKMHKFGDLEDFPIVFENTDNVGAPTGSSTAWNSSTYLGKILLDECNTVGLTMSTTLDRQITVVDGLTGKVTQNSGWDRDKHITMKGFRAENRIAIRNLKNLFRYLKGRQTTFYLPTFTNDLTAAETLGNAQNFLDIERINYARFVDDRDSRNTFRVTFTDGSSLIRVIQSSADHPSETDQERLTLNDTWPSEKLVSEVSRIEWVEHVRLDTDQIRYNYDRIGLVKVRVPVRVVFL